MIVFVIVFGVECRYEVLFVFGGYLLVVVFNLCLCWFLVFLFYEVGLGSRLFWKWNLSMM